MLRARLGALGDEAGHGVFGPVVLLQKDTALEGGEKPLSDQLADVLVEIDLLGEAE